jgi:rRNA maturation endonuclease Nob1
LVVSFKTGKSHDELILEFPRGKDCKAEYANTTYAPLTFCPFCGTKQEYETKKTKARREVAA